MKSKTNGSRLLNQLGKDADESKILLDILCKRVIKPAFDSGVISGRISDIKTLTSQIKQVINANFISDFEWAELCQRVYTWQDTLESCAENYAGSPLECILQHCQKFPTVEKTKALLGEEISDMYADALIHIEAHPNLFVKFPDERTNGGWNKQTIERAVSLVIDVIAPYGSDPDAMSNAYTKFMEEYRSQTYEKKMTQNAGKEARKKAARNLGIWLPVHYDLRQWETDLRTRDRAVEFQRIASRVEDKMRIMRSVLQFIPRRRFSNHTIADLDANIARMRMYIRDSENRNMSKKRLKHLSDSKNVL